MTKKGVFKKLTHTKRIYFRISNDIFIDLNRMSRKNGYTKISKYVRKIVEEMVMNSVGEVIKKEPVQQLPSDVYCRKVYNAFIKATNGSGGKVDKSNMKKVQFIAAISQMRTFKMRIKMLKAQGYLVEHDKYFVVLKKWKK